MRRASLHSCLLALAVLAGFGGAIVLALTSDASAGGGPLDSTREARDVTTLAATPTGTISPGGQDTSARSSTALAPNMRSRQLSRTLALVPQHPLPPRRSQGQQPDHRSLISRPTVAWSRAVSNERIGMSTTQTTAERRHGRPGATQLNGRQRRHDQAVIEAEVRRLTHAIRPFGVLGHEALARAAGAARWQTGQFDRALQAAVDQRRLERLPFDCYREAHGDPATIEPGSQPGTQVH